MTMISLITGSWVMGSWVTGSLIIGILTIGILVLGIWILWLMITGSWMMGSLITTHQVYSLITGSPLAAGLTKDIYLKIAPQADLKLLPTVSSSRRYDRIVKNYFTLRHCQKVAFSCLASFGQQWVNVITIFE